ncbi:MAG: cytidylate kinase-like family protein [Muribaculaceae bacterium]|nr:cytidylate kinase-like family protein [Muribaculaceae bacterium]
MKKKGVVTIMKYHYVVIEREYGSAGTEIGKKLSEISGIPCYGAEILERVSTKLNIGIDQIEQYEEKTTNSFLYSIYLMGKVNEGTDGNLSKEGLIYLEEQNVIRGLAEEGPAVFVGRCAANALEDRNDVLRVFIHADKNLRKKRAVEEYKISQNRADAVIQKFDRKRSSYFSANTGKDWRDLSNYHLVLDSGKLGIGSCAAILWNAMAKEQGGAS